MKGVSIQILCIMVLLIDCSVDFVDFVDFMVLLIDFSVDFDLRQCAHPTRINYILYCYVLFTYLYWLISSRILRIALC